MALKWMYQLKNRVLSITGYYAQPEVKSAIQASLGTTTAASVTTAAGTDGLAAGTVQNQLQALATRVAALEAG